LLDSLLQEKFLFTPLEALCSKQRYCATLPLVTGHDTPHPVE